MAAALTKQKAIEEIVKEVKKMDKQELQILLFKLRVKKMKLKGVKPAAGTSKALPEPSMEEINRWKHESRL